MKEENRFRLKNFYRLTFALLFIIVLITIVFFKSGQATDWLTHTLTVKIEIRKLLGNMQDAEIGQRGFIITKEEEYLDPYEEGKDNYRQNFEELKRLVGDNESQLARLVKIDTLVTLKFGELDATIDLVRGDSTKYAIRLVNKDRGKMLMDEIRELMEEMAVEERMLYESRLTNFKRGEWLIIGLVLISILLILYSIYRLYGEVQPLFEELVETKNMLQKASNNLSESLDNLKKIDQTKDEEIKSKEIVIQQHQDRVDQLQTEINQLKDILNKR